MPIQDERIREAKTGMVRVERCLKLAGASGDKINDAWTDEVAGLFILQHHLLYDLGRKHAWKNGRIKDMVKESEAALTRAVKNIGWAQKRTGALEGLSKEANETKNQLIRQSLLESYLKGFKSGK